VAADWERERYTPIVATCRTNLAPEIPRENSIDPMNDRVRPCSARVSSKVPRVIAGGKQQCLRGSRRWYQQHQHQHSYRYTTKLTHRDGIMRRNQDPFAISCSQLRQFLLKIHVHVLPRNRCLRWEWGERGCWHRSTSSETF